MDIYEREWLRAKLGGAALSGRSDLLLDGKVSDSRGGDRCGAVSTWVDSVLRAFCQFSMEVRKKRGKVTACELQWSHLSCCSIPVWAPGDHSHLDQWSRSPRSCQSACRPHRRTRRWLEGAEQGQESAHAPHRSPLTAHNLSLFMKCLEVIVFHPK